MKYESQKDIYLLVANELRIPEDKVEFVIRNLFENIRSELINPQNNQKGILINEFLKFYLDQGAIQKWAPYYKTEVLNKLKHGKKKTEE